MKKYGCGTEWQKLAEHRYGYTPFTVVLDNSLLPNSRWYTGGGIYRPVSILVGEDTHITWQGVHISTLSINPVKNSCGNRH